MKKKIKIVNTLIFITTSVVLVLGAWILYLYKSSNDGINELAELALQVQSYTETETPVTADNNMNTTKHKILSKYKDIYRQNTDLAGWVTIADTNINYPVMITPENPEFYLHHGFNKAYSYSGVPLMAGTCEISPSSDNIIIYGHNMKDKSMFSDLVNYRDESYYNEHPTVKFDTLFEENMYDVADVFQTEVSSDFAYHKYVNFDSEDEFSAWVSEIKKVQLYDTGIEFAYGSKFITMSTCSYHAADGRFVLIAVKCEDKSLTDECNYAAIPLN